MNDRRRVWSTKSGHLVLEELTDREVEVLEQVAAGYRNREIAERLNVTPKTVEYHLTNILAKLGARCRTEAVVRAWQLGRLAPQVIS
jgi:DNA-binding NarL/FixJ family response regulator